MNSPENNNQFNIGNSENDFVNLKNICSWLLIFSPIELAVISTILAAIVSNNLTIEEQVVLGSFAGAFGSELQLIAAQYDLMESARIELEELKEKDKNQNEIKELKEKLEESNKKIEKLEELLNQHIKNSLS